MNPVIVVTHASFDADRRAAVERLRSQLDAEADGIPWVVIEDADRKGSLDCWRRAMEFGLATEATHITWLPDDAILCKGFGKALRAAIASQPEQVFDCVVNHVHIHDAEHNPDNETMQRLRLESGWYTTPEGYCGGGGTMPRAALVAHLQWRADGPGWLPKGERGYLANDYGVNVWAMATGRLIWKTARSLIDHDTSIASLDGNDAHDFRRPLNFIADASELGGWGSEPLRLGPTYRSTHFEPLWNEQHWGPWDPEWSYRAQRGGVPVSESPHVFIAMPAARSPELAVRLSVDRNIRDCEEHGIAVTYFESPGDSLVTRGRHGLMNEFLSSPATHLLQWDDDVECIDDTAVRGMVQSGLAVVGGAYPWRDGSGRVVCNPLTDGFDRKTGVGQVDLDPKTKCIRIAEIGTGFLMTSRTCIVDLMRKHPELLYMADIEPYVGAPMWALFDSFLEVREDGRKRYASEDWRFCQLARAAGYGVHVYYPPVFRHWGKKAHEGHIIKAWRMNERPQRPAGAPAPGEKINEGRVGAAQ